MTIDGLNFVRKNGLNIVRKIGKEANWIIPFIIVVIGFLMLMAGFIMFPEKDSNLRNIMVSGGSAIVAGGMFSAVSKGMLFLGIFQQALQDVIYADTFIGNRKDLGEVWNKITALVAEQRFPELYPDITNLILNHYLPNTKNFFYEEVKKSFTIKGFDNKTDSYIIKDVTILKIKPYANAKFIDYHYKYIPSESELGNSQDIKINGKDISHYHQHVKDNLQNQHKGSEKIVLLELPPAEYDIVRKSDLFIPRTKNPFLKVTFKSYVKSCSVTAESKLDGVEIRFVDLGTLEKFTPHLPKDDEDERRVVMEYKNLLLPKQGYIILIVDTRLNCREEEEEG